LNTITINTQYANSQEYNTSTLNASAIYADGLITTFGNMSCIELEAETINSSTVNFSQVNASSITSDGGHYTSFTTLFAFITSDTPGEPPAVLKKVVDNVRLYAGNTTQPGTISLSTDNVSYPFLFDGNLNLATIANISTANISTLNVSAFGTTNNLVGKSANYGRQRTTELDPPDTDTVVYYDFTTESYANADLFTYTTPTPSATSGFRCRKAGWNRFAYSIHVLSKYGDRVQWLARPILNNTPTIGYSYVYTRGANYQCAWEGNCVSGGLIEFAVGDYFKIDVLVAKSDNTYGDNFQWLVFGVSNTISFEYLGT